MTLASRLIKEARSRAGLTQAELAERAGTSQPTIAAYESGDKVPNASTLERVLAATGTTLVASRRRSGGTSGSLGRLLKDNRAEIAEIARRHGAHNVRVFGSVARGEETDTSDVDLLVDMDPGSSLLDQVRLRRELATLLGVEVDLVTSAGLLQRDEATILAEAVPL
jgi:predicted nucleotidyltransferase/DNA-binding XRE family transcriptional regulator